jgi:Skp family chaperone for outer membrane proteins
VQDVNEKLDRRFEQNADELRKVDQDLKALRVAYERNLQMVEKQNELQQ